MNFSAYWRTAETAPRSLPAETAPRSLPAETAPAASLPSTTSQSERTSSGATRPASGATHVPERSSTDDVTANDGKAAPRSSTSTQTSTVYGSLDSLPSIVEGPGPAAEHLEAFEEAPDVDLLDEVALIPSSTVDTRSVIDVGSKSDRSVIDVGSKSEQPQPAAVQLVVHAVVEPQALEVVVQPQPTAAVLQSVLQPQPEQQPVAEVEPQPDDAVLHPVVVQPPVDALLLQPVQTAEAVVLPAADLSGAAVQPHVVVVVQPQLASVEVQPQPQRGSTDPQPGTSNSRSDPNYVPSAPKRSRKSKSKKYRKRKSPYEESDTEGSSADEEPEFPTRFSPRNKRGYRF